MDIQYNILFYHYKLYHYYSTHFKVIFKLNTNNKSGGIAIFINSKFQFNECDLSFLPDNKNLDLIGCTIDINRVNFSVFGFYNHNINNLKKLTETIHLLNKHFDVKLI